MTTSITNIGSYQVLLDAGFLTDAFTLDSSTLNGSDVLDGTTQFFDVTSYVQGVSISRGRQEFRQTIDAGRCVIKIDDRDGDFSVVNPASPYWDTVNDRLGFTPTKRVRVMRNGEMLFDGQIVTYDQQITLENRSYVTVVATDDLKVFDRIQLTAQTPTPERSDERIETILDLPEVDLFTETGQRVIEPGVTRLGNQKIEQGVKLSEYFSRIQLAEQGRIFIDRQGRFVAQSRVGRAPVSIDAEFSDQQDGDIPYRNFEVIYQ